MTLTFTSFRLISSLSMWQLIPQLRTISPLLFPGNGTVEYREFEDMMASQMGEPLTEEDLTFYFKKFDTNGDGYISSDELALVMKTFGGKSYSKKEIDDMIKQADIDADGKVSYAGTIVSFSCQYMTKTADFRSILNGIEYLTVH